MVVNIVNLTALRTVQETSLWHTCEGRFRVGQPLGLPRSNYLGRGSCLALNVGISIPWAEALDLRQWGRQLRAAFTSRCFLSSDAG